MVPIRSRYLLGYFGRFLKRIVLLIGAVVLFMILLSKSKVEESKSKIVAKGQRVDEDVRDIPSDRNVMKTNLTKNLKHDCESWYEDTFEENLAVISKLPTVGHAILKPKTDTDFLRMRENLKMMSFPVIATAADYFFYSGSQGLLESIHKLLLPKYKDLKIIYYDLGLSTHQLEELEKYCKCEVRKFPYTEFPTHVRNLGTYAFKPIIVQMLLQEFGWVWWMDSSIRFVSSDLDLAVKYSRDHSFLFFTYHVTLSVAQQTDPRTMQYFKEDACKYRYFGEVEATFMLFYDDNVTDLIVSKWASCALDKMCIAPGKTTLTCDTHNPSDGRCHRFDQSAISILLRRLFHEQNDYPLVEKPFHIHAIRRLENSIYFILLAEAEQKNI